MVSMAYGDRKHERVDFEHGVQVYIMGIDGTWRRDCLMVDVSQSGARLYVEGSLQGLDLKEFFLLLSSTGLAYRRCRMVRLMGDQIGVEFVKPAKTAGRKKSIPQPSATTWISKSRLHALIWMRAGPTFQRNCSMGDLHKINGITVTAKSTEPSTGIVQFDTGDAVIKFEITEDLAHLICATLERFLTRDPPPLVLRG
jgi:hypothetical protein